MAKVLVYYLKRGLRTNDIVDTTLEPATLRLDELNTGLAQQPCTLFPRSRDGL